MLTNKDVLVTNKDAPVTCTDKDAQVVKIEPISDGDGQSSFNREQWCLLHRDTCVIFH